MLIQSLIQQSDIKIIKQFVTNISQLPNIGTGEDAFFWRFSDLRCVPEVAITARNKLLEFVGECKQDPIFQDMFVFVKGGGCVYEHQNRSFVGYKHIRANVLIAQPSKGGQLITDGKCIEWQEGDAYLIEAQKPHSLTKIETNESFISLSYGFLVPL